VLIVSADQYNRSNLMTGALPHWLMAQVDFRVTRALALAHA